MEEWFALAGSGYSPKGARERRGVMDRNLLPFRSNVPLSKLGAADIDRFYRRLREKGGRVRPPAGAGDDPPGPRHPAPGARPGREVGMAERQPDYILLAAATGARRSELIALRWPDLDLDKASVWISRGMVLGDDGLVGKDTKTHAARRVSLDPTTVAAMTAHRARAEERARLCEHELDRRAFVFSNEIDGSGCWYPDSVSRAFARLCRKAGDQGRAHARPPPLRRHQAAVGGR